MKYVSLVKCLVLCVLYFQFFHNREDFDLQAHLYDHFRVIFVVCHLQKTHDATCSKSLRTKHHQQVCSSIQDPIEYGLHVINNILSPTMVLKS